MRLVAYLVFKEENMVRKEAGGLQIFLSTFNIFILLG